MCVCVCVYIRACVCVCVFPFVSLSFSLTRSLALLSVVLPRPSQVPRATEPVNIREKDYVHALQSGEDS